MHRCKHIFTLTTMFFSQSLSFSGRTCFLSQLSKSRRLCSQTTILHNDWKPIVICGPSGVGKGTLINKFMNDDQYKNQSDQFGFSVSHTTRYPRPGEQDGKHYHFTNIDKMQQAIDSGEFLEHANVHGNLYGTSYQGIEDVKANGKICLLDIDVQGVQNIKSSGNFCANFIFIAPPSAEKLKERLVGRGTETAESIEKRTQNAITEIEYGVRNGNFDRVIVNNRLDDACNELSNIIKELYGI